MSKKSRSTKKKTSTTESVKVIYKKGFADSIIVTDVELGRRKIKKGESAVIKPVLLDILQRQGFQFDIG